jgi:transcription elongation factor Elf1
MSIYIDRKFLLLLSPRLDRFAQKKDDLYNFRCPFCGDSQKNKYKARGYVYKKKNDYFYKCQNCGVGHTMYNFIKYIDPSMVKEYAMERYANGETGNNNYPKPTFEEFKAKPEFKTTINLPTIESLPEQHHARVYVESRRIPEAQYSNLYFAEDFKKFVEEVGVEKELKEKDQRLIIPFYNQQKELVAFQGRALGESKIRYITIKLQDDTDKFFGVDRVDWTKTVYVLEGPIDSMFIENSIATADSNLMAVGKTDNVVLVYDNEPRNKDIVKNIQKAIENNFSVCLWPKTIDYKDINDMVLGGMSPDEIKSIIDTHTFSGLRATLEFTNWKVWS